MPRESGPVGCGTEPPAWFASIVADGRGRVEGCHRVGPYDEADLCRRSAAGDVPKGDAVVDRFFRERSVR